MTGALVVLALLAGGGARAPAADGILGVRRIYVDRLTGGETAAQMRDMIMAALQGSRLFVITENVERADATLRGTAEDLIYTDRFSSSEGITARAGVSTGDFNYSTHARDSRAGSVSIGENESTHIQERKHEALAA